MNPGRHARFGSRTYPDSSWGYRKKRARKGAKGKLATPVEVDEWEETPNGSSDDGAEFLGETGGFWKGIGFVRNATFYNGFYTSEGQVFEFLPPSAARVLVSLLSITTIERLKKVLSEDAVAHAVSLIQGCRIFYIIFDNINIFLRKSQRLFNKNTMIHATNAAVISLRNADPLAEDLDAKRKRRGNRAAATGADIIPNFY
ncbi:hypothetical protein B0H13DRAFT_2317269 [Mycena leptocephala]|nr:hypothetical protein B0H13DRAFT_2317269 [Mycena leptocephala]